MKGICWKCEFKGDTTSKELDDGICLPCSNLMEQMRSTSAAVIAPKTSYKEERFYNTEVAKGVTGKDLIQPAIDGQPNQKFIDRYGDGVFHGKRSQLDGEGKKK